jgi:hypothetical protein
MKTNTLLREYIEAVVSEVTIKSRRGDADDVFDDWTGDDGRVLRALAKAGVSGAEREQIMKGNVPVSSSVLSMLRRDAKLKKVERPHEPKPYKERRPAYSVSKRQKAEKQLRAAVAKYASNWTNFTHESPDIEPEDAAGDAADGFFYEYPEWQQWLQAMYDPYTLERPMSKQDIKSMVTDYVYDAMQKGSKR